MTYQPTIGQLYLVRTRGEYKTDRTTEKCTLIMQAARPEDLEPKIRFHFDVSKYITFSITKIERIRPHVHVLDTKLIPVSDFDGLPAAFRIEKNSDSPGSSGAQRTNQPSGGNVFAIGIAGKIGAKDGDHALRRLGKYLLRLGLGETEENPLFDGGTIIVEQEGEVDSTVTTASQGKRLDATYMDGKRPFAGGAVGMGKR